ncbi:hypothetical protein ABW20_dc0102927 [Dactylellina cionopaga]|nr:hypothetical protein ABW20_dc0102927 [Dactylellina cionopaga]
MESNSSWEENLFIMPSNLHTESAPAVLSRDHLGYDNGETKSQLFHLSEQRVLQSTPQHPSVYQYHRILTMDATITPEAMRQQQRKQLAEKAASETSPEQTWLLKRTGSPEPPVLLPYDSMRGLIKDLADRALKQGFRQPLNFHDEKDDEKDDRWSIEKEIARYRDFDVMGPADKDDPAQVITNNEGMVMYELWYQVWIKIKDEYMVDSLLPDIRNVMLHKDMTYRLIPLIKSEIHTLQYEKSRIEIYNRHQLVKLGRGAKERIFWLEDMEGSILHMRKFQTLLDELPDDAMMAKKHFKNFKPDYRDGFDYGFDE